jgi:hypothetical protein
LPGPMECTESKSTRRVIFSRLIAISTGDAAT